MWIQNELEFSGLSYPTDTDWKKKVQKLLRLTWHQLYDLPWNEPLDLLRYLPTYAYML